MRTLPQDVAVPLHILSSDQFKLSLVLVKMDSINHAQHDAEVGHEPKREMSTMDVDEEAAIRKVEAANTPDLNAQSGVRKVEAVTLAWTKTSLACAFVW